MANNDEQKKTTFLKKSKQQLDDSVSNLDAEVKDKLFTARRKIIAQHHNKPQDASIRSRFKRLLPVTSIALTASIALGIFIQTGMWQSNGINFDTDMELVSTLDNLELYDDLEFYQWLAEDELQTG